LAEYPTIVFELAFIVSDVAIDSAAITTATVPIVTAVVTAPPVPVMVMATMVGVSPVADAMRSPTMVLRHHRAGTGKCEQQDPHCYSFHLTFSLDQNSALGGSR